MDYLSICCFFFTVIRCKIIITIHLYSTSSNTLKVSIDGTESPSAKDQVIAGIEWVRVRVGILGNSKTEYGGNVEAGRTAS